jgi:hypothetical protein
MCMAAGLSRESGSGLAEPGSPAVPGPPGSPSPPGPAAAKAGWTAGRVIALAAGSVLLLVCMVLLGGAGVLTWADQAQQGGYLTTGTATYSTSGYALASDPVKVHGLWGWLGSFAGEIRIRVSATSPGQPVFVAIGPAGDVSRYLAGVRYTSVTALGDHDVTQHLGSVVPAPPAAALHWATRAQGAGTATLRWTIRSGDWMVVVMHPDGSPGVTVRAEAGVSSPVLPALASKLLAAGTGADGRPDPARQRTHPVQRDPGHDVRARGGRGHHLRRSTYPVPDDPPGGTHEEMTSPGRAGANTPAPIGTVLPTFNGGSSG